MSNVVISKDFEQAIKQQKRKNIIKSLQSYCPCGEQ